MPIDPTSALLAIGGLAGAALLAVVVGRVSAQLFFRASRDGGEDDRER